MEARSQHVTSPSPLAVNAIGGSSVDSDGANCVDAATEMDERWLGESSTPSPQQQQQQQQQEQHDSAVTRRVNQQRRVLPVCALFVAPRVFGGNDVWAASKPGAAAFTTSAAAAAETGEEQLGGTTKQMKHGDKGEAADECDDCDSSADASDDNVGDSDDDASVASTFSCLSRDTSASSALSDSSSSVQAANDEQRATRECDYEEIHLPDDLYTVDVPINASAQGSPQQAAMASSVVRQLQLPHASPYSREMLSKHMHVQQRVFGEHQRRMLWLQQQVMQQHAQQHRMQSSAAGWQSGGMPRRAFVPPRFRRPQGPAGTGVFLPGTS
ncbi:hypothetical protein CLOM_g19169 [Closterium sp. NIES-68]|nr:hypothetical protein CLOM_g19169 [Closterium sp. NIES-68]GJP68648.1 hypothetical protein CLOP_g25320 [Closterium sp. NIES-67]